MSERLVLRLRDLLAVLLHLLRSLAAVRFLTGRVYTVNYKKIKPQARSTLHKILVLCKVSCPCFVTQIRSANNSFLLSFHLSFLPSLFIYLFIHIWVGDTNFLHDKVVFVYICRLCHLRAGTLHSDFMIRLSE